MIEPAPPRRRGLRRMVLVVSLVVAVLAPAAPAYASSRSAPVTRAARLQLVPDLPDVLSNLLPGLFPSEGPPPLAPAVQSRVAASTVRIAGRACGAIQVGSGFSVGSDTAATAAHVVAGVSRPVVFTPDGRRLAATVVLFDADRDLALLRVGGLGEAPLPLGRPSVGEEGAVFGHPEGQPAVEVSPATVVAIGTPRLPNLYGTPVQREVLRLTAVLEPGDSGGPLVDTNGAVIGVAFAVSTRRADVAYAVSSRELQPLVSTTATSPVSTGPCVAA